MGETGLRGLQLARIDSLELGTLKLKNVPVIIKSPPLRDLPTGETESLSPLALGYSMIIDYGTKKLKNVRENPSVALVVDRLRPTRAVAVEGTCEVYERGPEYLRLLELLMKRFEFYRKNPWVEGESPIFRLTPQKAVSWGLGLGRVGA